MVTTKQKEKGESVMDKYNRLAKHNDILYTDKFVAYTNGEAVLYGDGTYIDFCEAQENGYAEYFNKYNSESIKAGTYTIKGDDSYAVGCIDSVTVTLKGDGKIYFADGVSDRGNLIGTFRKEIELDGYYNYGDVINVYQDGNNLYIETLDRINLDSEDCCTKKKVTPYYTVEKIAA